MRCQIRNAAHGITLNLDIGRGHLLYKWLKASQGDDGDLIFGYLMLM